MKIIKREDKEFPIKLLEVKPIIKQIYVEGNEKILNNFGIAVIGSRNSSREGERITDEFVSKLSKFGINIISGLAIGIDSRAHRSCIENGGKTIAIIGSGFNYIYPTENKNLFKTIIETGGAVISEYQPNTDVKPENFPKRNRIVSGLSDGILMIEGKYRSGTTITAKFGLNQGKIVFCIPHSMYNPYGTGPNKIIQKGGKLVTTIEDIVEIFNKKGIKLENIKTKNIEMEFIKKSTVKSIQSQNEYSDILKELSEEVLTKEELSEKMNMTISEINQKITILELEGLIKEEPGRGFSLIK